MYIIVHVHTLVSRVKKANFIELPPFCHDKRDNLTGYKKKDSLAAPQNDRPRVILSFVDIGCEAQASYTAAPVQYCRQCSYVPYRLPY